MTRVKALTLTRLRNKLRLHPPDTSSTSCPPGFQLVLSLLFRVCQQRSMSLRLEAICNTISELTHGTRVVAICLIAYTATWNLRPSQVKFTPSMKINCRIFSTGHYKLPGPLSRCWLIA
ncbi:hypothetical protein DAEQUDRAFT_63208 [Daedalea quercina L-15889]|uniref:Uncharacterized protein n=1 Tax=Daedalea quercina L-15889 TaxID=1314783 RepID=A0A165SMN4_9APHY|nr:hypothetical protein DAEQUDRAFT_63208 [Daedalea quercina L-15889]